MIDTVQLILLVVIVLLTILLLVLGIQVFFILRELKKTIFHATEVLKNTEDITENISKPVSFVSGFLFSAKGLSVLSKLFKSNKKKE